MINHIAIIMDGNRRWAKSKGKLAVSGHKQGAKTLENIAEIASNKGIKYLTVWGLSTENLEKRSKVEVLGIITLLNGIEKYTDRFMKENLKLQLIGDLEKFPEKTRKKMQNVVDATSNNTGIILTLALVYGGQNEIIRGVQKAIESGIDLKDIDEKSFREFLDCNTLPEPDVIVRTGGDIRHSGFMLYDSAYSEYYFTETLWPDFDEAELDKVVESFNKSKRNFGK